MRLATVIPTGLKIPRLAFFSESGCVLLQQAIAREAIDMGIDESWGANSSPIDWLTEPAHREILLKLAEKFDSGEFDDLKYPLTDCQWGLPIPQPNKFLLLAGNYAEHIIERGGTVAEREETFPYLFLKPPSTTLVPHGASVAIPKNASDGVDWEAELGVVIGKRGRHIPAEKAMDYVLGYTIVNDISQRKYRPNPNRKKRERDVFFDWQHGKWFDGFAPCGPCLATPESIPDPQNLSVKLWRNGNLKQNGSTGQMIFSVAEIIQFISGIVTLEPGDLISTGTPSGVGSATGEFLQPNDEVTVTIDRIGTLTTKMIAE